MDLEQPQSTPSVGNQSNSPEEEKIDPKELYDYLMAEEPKTSQIYLEILASLTMTPSPIDNPQETLLQQYSKIMSKLLIDNFKAFNAAEFKSHLEKLCSMGFVEILESTDEISILNLIQTYILQADHQNSTRAIQFYLEFLEAGILETYSTEQAVSGDQNISSVFKREDKISIINKISDLLEEYSNPQNRHLLYSLSRRVLSNLYLPGVFEKKCMQLVENRELDQFDTEFEVLEEVIAQEPKLKRVLNKNFKKQLENYFLEIEDFYEKFKVRGQLHTMAHFAAYNSTIQTHSENSELKAFRLQHGKIKDFLELGKKAISSNPSSENYFDQSKILDLWRKIDSSIGKEPPKKLEKGVSLLDNGQLCNSRLLSLFYELIDACELLYESQIEMTKRALFQSMIELILKSRVKLSDFQTFKIFKLALVQVPRSVEFASYFVQIHSQCLNSLDTCLEQIGELLWNSNKIVLFKTWIMWFNKVINILTNTIRNSGEQRSNPSDIYISQEGQEEIQYPPVTTECITYVTNMLEYIQVSIATFLQSAKNARDNSTLKKSVYQARVTYSTIVKNTIMLLSEIRNPQQPTAYIESKLEDLVKQCGNNPQNWIFYLKIQSENKLDNQASFDKTLEKLTKVYKRALNFCKGDIFTIYKWYSEYLTLFGVAQSPSNEQESENIFRTEGFSGVKELLGIGYGNILSRKKEAFKSATQLRSHFFQFVAAGIKGEKGAPRRKDFQQLIGKL